jgi:hypothetical protein
MALMASAAAGCSLSSPPWPPPTFMPLGIVPLGLAVNATTIYVSQVEEASVIAVPVIGGAPSSVGISAVNGELAVDDQRLYWSDGSALYDCDKSNCLGSTITLAADHAVDVSPQGDHVFWAAENDSGGMSGIMMADKQGGAAIQIASAGMPDRLAVDAENVYWIDRGLPAQGSLMKAPIAGGPTTRLAALDSAVLTALALDADHVYFLTGSGQLFAVQKSGGPAKVLLSDLGVAPSGLATDETNLYVTGSDSLLRMPVGGGPVIVLTTDLGTPTRLALGDTRAGDDNVYVGDAAWDAIVKVAK